MKAKKFLSAALAAMLALGTFAALPAETGFSPALVAEAESYATIPDFKATPGNRSVSLTWTKEYGIYGYNVYYRESGTSSYTLYKRMTTPSCNVTGLKSGTGYDFYVIAYDTEGVILAKAIVYNVVPSDKNNVSENGFVISTDSDGLKYVASYKGAGGSITIPSSVDYIGEDAFKENTSITSVTVPSGCSSVGNYAFQDCIKLKKVVFEGSASVGEDAFLRCFNLETVEFKKSILNISAGAFQHCQALTKITAGESKGTCTIGTSSFYGCISLRSISIPENCSYIYPLAFTNCFSLSEITIPDSTRFYYDGDNAHIGYFYASKTEDKAWDEVYYLGIGDGKTSVYYQTLSNSPISNTYARYGNMYLSMKKYTPAKVTMIVTKDSDAEKYAKKNGIAYKYASGTSSSSSSRKLSAPENFRASKKTTTSITLAWDAVDDADAYAVYIYDSKTGKYKKYKSVQSAKCAVTDLKKGTKYKFRVAALKKVNGKYQTGTLSDAITVSTKSAQ